MNIGAYLLDVISEAEDSEFKILILGKDCSRDVEIAGQFFPSCVIYSAEVSDEDIDALKGMNIFFDYAVITSLIDNDEKWDDVQRVLSLLGKGGQLLIACPDSNIISKISDQNLLITKFGLFGDSFIRLSLKKEEAYLENCDVFPDAYDGLKGYLREVNSFNMYNIVLRESYQEYDHYLKNLAPLKKEVKFSKEANDILKNKILKGSPFCALRLGNTEATLIDNYLRGKLEGKRSYSDIAVNYAISTGGFFVPDGIDSEVLNDQLDDLVRIQLEGFTNSDILMLWGACRIEATLANHFVLPSCDNISFFSLIPYVAEYEPWTVALAGKKVLVVTSVPDSIEYQYKRKDAISPYKISVLPDFTLTTYRMLQTCQQDKKGFDSWGDALEYVEKDILDIDFDIAIVGAGFYGVPICNSIKKSGKIAIEMCGLTPFIFGVAGKRFIQDQKDFYGKYMTDAWIRPFDEKPLWYSQVENGCYW